MGTKNYFKILFGFLFTILIMGSVFADVASSIHPVGGFARSESTYANIGEINTLLGDCSTISESAAVLTSLEITNFDYSETAATAATLTSLEISDFDYSETAATAAVLTSLEISDFDYTDTNAIIISNEITSFDFSGLYVVGFNISDGSNDANVALTANYTNIAGLIATLEAQKGDVEVTFEADGENKFKIISDASGSTATIIISEYDKASQGQIIFGDTGNLTEIGEDKNKTFTIATDDDSNVTIVFNANYTNIEGLFGAVNTQIDSDINVTASAGEGNYLVLTHDETGADYNITITGTNAADFFGETLFAEGVGVIDNSKTFTIATDDDSNVTIVFNANYTNIEGLFGAVNTQIDSDINVTASAGEGNYLVLTHDETGADYNITITGTNAADFFGETLFAEGVGVIDNSKTFTIATDDDSNVTIVFDTDYTNIAGIVSAVNTQINDDINVTASAGDGAYLVLTHDDVNSDYSITLSGVDVEEFFDLFFAQGIDEDTSANKVLSISVDGGETQTKTFDANYLDEEGAFANWDAFLTAINFTGATETASDGANIKITSSSTGIDSNVTIITDDAGLFETPFEIHGFDDSYSLSNGWNLVSVAYFIDTNNSTIYDGDPTKIYKHTKNGFVTADVEDLSPVDAIFVKTNNATTVLGMNFAEEDPDDAIVMDQKELTTGWNLISVPYNMQSNTINQAFAQLIEGSNLGLTTVYNWYNSNIITDWATGLNYDQGYWVNMNQDDWYSQPVAIVVEE